jgi:microcystin-dependent protein
MNPFLSMIMLWPCNFAPLGWNFCSGQLLSISQNAALFSLIGTYYGGDGVQTFALPDFRGRVPVGAGSGPGRSTYVLGQAGGIENVSMTIANLPAHTHPLSITVSASNVQATAITPSSAANTLAAPYDGVALNGVNAYVSGAPNVPLNVGPNGPTGATGSNQPISVVQPYLAVNYVIALQGIFPSRG